MGVIKYIGSIVSETRFSQFLSVGILGALVDNGTLAAFVELIALDPLLAKVIAAELSIIVMFAINERWTFAAFGRAGIGPLLRRFIKSNAVRAGGVLVAIGVLYVLHTQLGVWYLVANIFGVGVGFIVNYTAESLFTWGVQTGA
ncbi:GtrA family protein [Saliphagus sp. LR7]|uniref:GtrA family protein n=1 Tax=Saliphagus sp. LR7 TaxID=2282654 RepID=UPI000DF7B964|nr:GtrA family protein [Saliphagus sp. LR7]